MKILLYTALKETTTRQLGQAYTLPLLLAASGERQCSPSAAHQKVYQNNKIFAMKGAWGLKGLNSTLLLAKKVDNYVSRIFFKLDSTYSFPGFLIQYASILLGPNRTCLLKWIHSPNPYGILGE